MRTASLPQRHATAAIGPHRKRLTIIWLGLAAATIVSLFTSESAGLAANAAFLIIVLLAYLKARLVLFEFMEVGSGSHGWRLFFEAWLMIVVVVICLFHSW